MPARGAVRAAQRVSAISVTNTYRWTLDALSGRFLTAVRFGRFKDFMEPLGADQKTRRGGQNAILVYIAHILQLQHPPHICT